MNTKADKVFMEFMGLKDLDYRSALLIFTALLCGCVKVKMKSTFRPLVQTVSPASVFLSTDRPIHLLGQDFHQGMRVQIGTENCQSLRIISSTELECLPPSFMSAGVRQIQIRGLDDKDFRSVASLTYDTTSFRSVERLVGTQAKNGHQLGARAAVKLTHPGNILISGDVMYISDSGNHIILAHNMVQDETVVLAGKAGHAGHADGVGVSARFTYPVGLALKDNMLYVSETDSCLIRRIDLASNSVTTIVGAPFDCESLSTSEGLSSRLAFPKYIAIYGNELIVTGFGLARVQLTPPYPVSSISTSPSVNSRYTTGVHVIDNQLYFIATPLNSVSFNLYSFALTAASPYVLSSLESNNSDFGHAVTVNNTQQYFTTPSQLYQRDPAFGTSAVVAGDFETGDEIGVGPQARFRALTAAHIASDGKVYLVDTGNHKIKVYDPISGVVENYLGGQVD